MRRDGEKRQEVKDEIGERHKSGRTRQNDGHKQNNVSENDETISESCANDAARVPDKPEAVLAAQERHG